MLTIPDHHACIDAGGNNENEASFGWFPETQANLPLYAVDFSRLFVDAIRQVSFVLNVCSLAMSRAVAEAVLGLI